jgi:hypothetical protein
MADPARPNPDAQTYQEWVSVFETGTDFEADMVRDRLDDNGLAAVVLTQRDHAFNLNVGDLSAVHVMVRPEDAAQAREILADVSLTDEELESAAMNADPLAPDAHNAPNEAMLDSGLDALRLSPPDEREDDGDEPPSATRP